MGFGVVGEGPDDLATARDLLQGLRGEGHRCSAAGNGHDFVGGERADTNNNGHAPMKPQAGRGAREGFHRLCLGSQTTGWEPSEIRDRRFAPRLVRAGWSTLAP